MPVIEAEAAPQLLEGDKTNIPKIITWHKTKMLRRHSFLSTVRQIVKRSSKMDVVQISIVGDMSSGKTELSKSIAHYGHKIAKKDYGLPYAVRFFDKDNLMNFEETLANLSPTNYFMIFDDISFLEASANKKEINKVKQAVTTIRHLPGGKDVKIVIIKNYHYSLGLDKYLRMSNFSYFTTIGESEIDNIEKQVKHYNMKKVYQFKKRLQQGQDKDHFTFKIGKKELFSYKWRDPFQPALFWDTDTLRDIITPLRTFEDPICSTCSAAKGTLQKSEIDVRQFNEESDIKFGKGAWKSAVKLELLMNGLNTYSPKVVQASRYLQKALSAKEISLEELALVSGLEITKTKLKKKLDGVLK